MLGLVGPPPPPVVVAAVVPVLTGLGGRGYVLARGAPRGAARTGGLDIARRNPGGAFERPEVADEDEGSVFSLTASSLSSLSTLSSPVRTRGRVKDGGDRLVEEFAGGGSRESLRSVTRGG